LKEAIVEQQIKISKLERQGFTSFPNLSTVATPTEVAYTCELDTPEGLSAAESEPSILSAVYRNEAAVRCEKERNEKEAQEKKEREERDRAEREEREAQEKKDREEREDRKRQDKTDREARKKKQREERERKEQEERAEKERIEREAREQAEREAKEQAEREAKELAENAARERADRVARRRAQKEAVMKAEQEAKEKTEREAKERAEEEARVKAEEITKQKAAKKARERAKREAREKAEQEAREKAEREAKEREEREEVERLEREKERLEREEIERLEREEKETADRETKGREEEERKKASSKTPSAWGSTVGRNDRSRKTSGLSQKEQKNEWANTWDFGPTGKGETSGLPPIITSSVPGGVFDGTSNFADIFAAGKNDSPGGAEEVELRTPLTKKGKKGINNLSKVATPTEPADLGKLDILENLNMNNMSARVSVSSENERFTDAEQGTSRESTPPGLAPEVVPEALSSITSELLRAPDIKVEVPTIPKPLPPPANPAQALAPEPEKPLPLWERKKLKTATQPAPASSLFGGGDAMSSSGVRGEAGGGGGNTESIVTPTLVGDHQSIFTDTARGQKRDDQRENLVEGFLGSNPARRRNDSAKLQMPASSVTKPVPPPQKSGGWGPWGDTLLGNIARVIVERSPSPEPPSVKPKIEDPPKGFTPNQPPKSQPAGFGSSNKPAWGNDGWGVVKTGPTPISQNTSTGPAWGAKPIGSTPGPGGTPWGSGGGSLSGLGAGRNLTVDTTTKPLKSSPNPAWLKSITECGDRKEEGPIC